MMGAVAQYEKSQIVLKLRGARMRKRAKKGRCEGRKPYGSMKASQRLWSGRAHCGAEGLWCNA